MVHVERSYPAPKSLKEDTVLAEVIGEMSENAERTVELLNEVFNLKNTGMRTYACKRRMEKLQQEMNIFYKRLRLYKEKPGSIVNQKMLKSLLRRESQFAAFKRGYIRKYKKQYPLLQEYLE